MPLQREVENALRNLKHACYAGLDSVSLRQEVIRRIGSVVPSDACCLTTADPAAGLINHALGERLSSEKAREFLANIYPEHEADLFLDMATSGAPVATLRLSASGTRSSHHSAAFGNWLQEQGFCYELRAVFSVRGVLWGTGCWMRGGRGRAFDEREVRLLRRAVPHVARALRAAALKEATQNGSALDSPGDDPLIGVLATSTDDRIVFGNLPAQRYLADLARHDRWDFSDSRLPWVLSLVLGRVSHLPRGKARGEGAECPEVRLNVRGASGQWYRLRASLSLSELGTDANAVKLALIAPVGLPHLATVLAELHGLSPREREVIGWVVRGESSREMAARLNLSVHTVQDHVNHACQKLGVRGRKQLLAYLFGTCQARVP